MFYNKSMVVLAIFGLVATSAPAFAVTGAGGPDLPEYARAVGTIENGPGSTGMTIEEANRIIARENRNRGYAENPAPAPVVHKHHHVRQQ